MRLYSEAAAGFALLLSTTAVSGHDPAPEYFDVIGTLKNLDYKSIDDPDDMLGHGWITARLRIERVLSGGKLPGTITVRYLAHTYWQEAAGAQLKLLRDKDGGYFLCAPADATGVQCPRTPHSAANH